MNLKKLVKVYRTTEVETTALDNLNIEVKEGEFVSIMGPSGCGKSTLLNVLGLIDSPTGGNYFFLDEDVAQYSERQRSELRKNNIGFIFQAFNCQKESSLRDVVYFLSYSPKGIKHLKGKRNTTNVIEIEKNWFYGKHINTIAD